MYEDNFVKFSGMVQVCIMLLMLACMSDESTFIFFHKRARLYEWHKYRFESMWFYNMIAC